MEQFASQRPNYWVPAAILLGAILAAMLLLSPTRADALYCKVCVRLDVTDVSHPDTVERNDDVTIAGRLTARRAEEFPSFGDEKANPAHYKRCLRNIKVEVSLTTQIAFSKVYAPKVFTRTDRRGRFSVTLYDYDPPDLSWSAGAYLYVRLPEEGPPDIHRGEVTCLEYGWYRATLSN